MKSILKSIVVVALTLAMPLGMIHAKGKKTKSDAVSIYLNTYDKNKDGVIDRTEFPGSPAEFAKWDTNRDGKLDRAELAVMLDVHQ